MSLLALFRGTRERERNRKTMRFHWLRTEDFESAAANENSRGVAQPMKSVGAWLAVCHFR